MVMKKIIRWMNFRPSAICGSALQAYIAAMAKGKVLRGTSGWSCKHWKAPFSPENIPGKIMLSFCCQSF
jgi:hypothetical protein